MNLQKLEHSFPDVISCIHLNLPLKSLPLVYAKHYQIWFLVGIHDLPYSASMERNTSGQAETGA